MEDWSRHHQLRGQCLSVLAMVPLQITVETMATRSQSKTQALAFHVNPVLIHPTCFLPRPHHQPAMALATPPQSLG